MNKNQMKKIFKEVVKHPCGICGETAKMVGSFTPRDPGRFGMNENEAMGCVIIILNMIRFRLRQ